MNPSRLNLIASFSRCLFTSLLITILLPIVYEGNLSVASETFTPAKLASTSTDIDRAIANGEMEKAIPLLDSQLVQARRDKDVFLEAKLLSQLQFAHYCKGGLRRSLVIGQDLSDVLEGISKRGISDPRIASTIADNTILYMYTEIERGDTGRLTDRINDFLKDLSKATTPKAKARFYLGLAYTYYLSNNTELFKENFDKFKNSYPNLDNLDAVEDIQLIFSYVKLTKELNSNKEDYRNGISLIEKVKKKYGSKIPMIVPFTQLNIASLHSIGGDYNTSSSILTSHLQYIDRMPTYFRFMTWDILGDNAFAQKEYVLAKKYYSLLERKLSDKIRQEGSDATPALLLKNVFVKIARTNSNLPTNSNSFNKELSKTDIMTILVSPDNVIGSGKDTQNWANNLVGDSLMIQDSLLAKGSLWDAFAVSEYTRAQLSRKALGNQLSPMFDVEVTSRMDMSYHPFKDSIFPNSVWNFAFMIQAQNTVRFNEKYGDRVHMIRGNGSATIVEYAYNFIEDRPKEIYVYVFKPERDTRKMKPIVRCINLDPSSSGSTCKAYSQNQPSSQALSSTERASIAKLGFKNYISRNLTNVINCRQGEISRQNGCSSQINTDSKKTYKSLQALHQLLIEPIADLLPTNSDQKVIFIPQGQLFSIPFAALQNKQGKYLIEQHTISIAPSLILLGQTSNLYLDESRATANKVLVVGNPTMSRELSLSQLPAAETEARTIAQIYGVEPLIGSKASKEAVLGQFAGARIVHLATHGLIDKKNSLENSVALAPTPTNPRGTLMAREIPRNNAELVILSVCNSGKGEVSTDGVAGFSTQLILAGNPSHVVSLWAVNDRSTSEIMVDFHRELRRGQSKTHALRDAMLKTMSSSKYADPYYWAPFILVGNTQ